MFIFLIIPFYLYAHIQTYIQVYYLDFQSKWAGERIIRRGRRRKKARQEGQEGGEEGEGERGKVIIDERANLNINEEQQRGKGAYSSLRCHTWLWWSVVMRPRVAYSTTTSAPWIPRCRAIRIIYSEKTPTNKSQPREYKTSDFSD